MRVGEGGGGRWGERERESERAGVLTIGQYEIAGGCVVSSPDELRVRF